MEPPSILLVDDEPANVQVLFAALRDMGRVQFATSGQKALELAAAMPPDVVFLDLVMPGMDGIAVCRALKSRPETRAAEVIFVSGDGDPDQVEAALDAGAFDFMVKPVIPRLARRRAEIALGHRRHAAPDRIRRPIGVGPKRLLLVEDGEINRLVIGEIIKTAGHKVTMAGSGAEALELAGKEDFDCILLDIHLPDMTGLKVIRYLRSLPGANADTRVIAVTGDVTAESLDDYKSAGFDGVSPKPIDPECLLDLISGRDVDMAKVLPSAPEIGGPDLLIAPDRMATLKRTYSEERLRELYVLFEREVHGYLAALDEAFAKGDGQQVMQTAHRLKSALGHFACAKMQGVAQLLSKDADMPVAERKRLIGILEEQLAPTLSALAGALDLDKRQPGS